ncbi:MAG: hypothetical protein IPP41_07425 [Rhodocyclaceae bacterium]|nr:hypothetical protein [Rhodocyclaceae bacterium]
MIGDSWFWYPLDNLAGEIGSAMSDQTLVVVGYNGAEAAQWSEKYRKDIDFGFKMYGADVRALMLSGGGNDIAGMSDFLRLLKDDCSKAKTVSECFREGQPEALIAKIIGAYREVILRFRAYNSDAPVLMHNYDNAWPTGKGLFGPSDWLKAPMEKAKVPKDLRRTLFKELIERLGLSQLALKKEKALGLLIAIQSAGTMPEDDNGKDQWQVLSFIRPLLDSSFWLEKLLFLPSRKLSNPAYMDSPKSKEIDLCF